MRDVTEAGLDKAHQLFQVLTIDDIIVWVAAEYVELAWDLIYSSNKNLLLLNIKHSDGGIRAISKYRLGLSSEGYYDPDFYLHTVMDRYRTKINYRSLKCQKK